VKDELHRTYKKRDLTSERTYLTYSSLTGFFSSAQLYFIHKNAEFTVSKQDILMRHKLKLKLEKLITTQKPDVPSGYNQKHNTAFHFFKRVVNLSSTEFNNEESLILNNGLSFASNSLISKKHLYNLIAHTDSILQTVSDKFSCNLDINKLVTFFKTFKFSKSNRTERDLTSTLIEKIKVNNLIVSKADKGNCLVIQDKIMYINKTHTFLDSNGFISFDKDPTNTYNNKLKSTIKHIHPDFFAFFNTSPSSLINPNPLTPLLYSLPKIHKPDTPQRPIVSSINSPAHNLSTFLRRILPDIIKFNPRYTLKNSSQLCKHLSDIFIPNNSILFSFDVNNLFTNIPHSECINILNSHLHNSDVPDHIAEYLLSLTKLALEQDFFRFNNRFYKQSDGLAMGSPLSPFLSELFMSSFEEQLNLSPFFNNNIIIWRRYVDDIFGIFHGSLDDLKLFHSWLNSRHPKIKFSIELGKKDTLPFLDLLISIDNNKASFNIYRKPTTTDLLIPYNSTAPLSHKLASFRFLFNRLHSVPMSNTNFTSELNTIFYLAKVNNYPYVTINNLHQKIRIKHLTPNTTLSRTTSSHLFFSLPFLPHISQKVASVITNQCPQIKISFTTSHLKLKSVFF